MKECVITTKRETHLQSVKWNADAPTKQVLFLVHSYGDVSLRYEWLARFYTQKGWDVISFDLAAHGRSGGLRAKWRSLDDLIEDIDCVIQHYLKTEPNYTTWVGFGMGLGATLLNLYEFRNPESVFERHILWAPLIRLSTRFPKVLLDSIKYVNSFTSHLNVLTLHSELLTSNTEALYAAIPDWDEDYGKVSAQTAGIIIDSGKMMMKNWDAVQKPKWVGWGADDQFVDSSWFKMKSENATFRVNVYEEFADATHFLEQDSLGLQVAKKINEWLKLNSQTSETIQPVLVD